MEGGISNFYKRHWFALITIPIRIVLTVVQFIAIREALRVLINFVDTCAYDFKVLVASVIVFFVFEMFTHICIMIGNHYRYPTITKSTDSIYRHFDTDSHKNPAKVLKPEPMTVQNNLHLIYQMFSTSPSVIAWLQNLLVDIIIYSLISFVQGGLCASSLLDT